MPCDRTYDKTAHGSYDITNHIGHNKMIKRERTVVLIIIKIKVKEHRHTATEVTLKRTMSVMTVDNKWGDDSRKTSRGYGKIHVESETENNMPVGRCGQDVPNML